MQTHLSLAKYVKSVLFFCMLFVISGNAFASHIVTADLYYTWQSGNTYKVTVVLYGDCGFLSAGSYATLPISSPQVCVFNNTTLYTTLNLAIQPPTCGVEVTPVCPDSVGHTQCNNPSSSTPGIKKFVYVGFVMLSGPSHYWRFVYNGSNGSTSQPLGCGSPGSGVPAASGRAAAITNITGTTTIQLIDTLDNTWHNNSNPVLTTVPTPFYCLDHAACYGPGAVDADGDNIIFGLTPAVNGTSVCGAVGGPVSYTSAFSAWPGQPITAATPLQVATGSYSMDAATGNICFNPNQLQRSTVVYNIREYRNDTFIGSCQRELTILVQPCVAPNPSGIYNSATAGVINDSTHFTVCSGIGPYSIFMNPTEPGFAYNITVTPSGLPPGLSFTTTGNGTPTPHCTISWTTTSVAPGTYPFYVTFSDNACPLAGSLTRAFYITVIPGPSAGTISGANNVCVGQSVALSETVAGGTWSSTSANVSVSSSGIVLGMFAGTATITYTVSSPTCGLVSATYPVTVNPLPAPITGALSICTGNTSLLSDASPGGTWSSSNPVAPITSGGTVSGSSAGTSVITYKLSTGCYTTVIVTVVATPTSITGSPTVCVGSTTTLGSTPTGGTWASDAPSIASIVGAGPSVLGVTTGTARITYTLTGGCLASITVTVYPLPNAGTISGPSAVCAGSTITLTDPAPGGAWSSSNTNASVTSGGIVTGVSGGTVTISYTVTNSCGTVAATRTVTVDIAPTAGTITGTSVICVGATTTLTDAAPGGVWSASNTNVTISSGGLVTGVAAGTTLISYTVTNSCGTATATRAMTVQVLPVVSPITGLNVVCVASSITLADATPGGVWSSTSANATITPGGVVTGVTAGTTTISYTVTNSCGTVAATYIVTVNPLPAAGAITGGPVVCAGSTILLTDPAPGGIWSSTTGNATIAPDGTVTGVTPGTTIISYTVTNSCGTAAATKVITINPLPVAGSISGPNVVCVASSITLSDAATGGAWSSTTANATVTSAGLVTGVTAGTTIISYTVTNSCGTIAAAYPVTINPLPNAGVITGPASVCVGSSITLTDLAPGGVWSSTSANTTITPGGIVTGVNAGTTTISYTVTNSCGTAAATKVISVNPLPNAGTITGPAVVCEAAAILLTDAAPGGVWSISNTNATISSGGIVNGVTAGTATVSYTVTNVCGTAIATTTITINPLPVPGTITGPNVVCVASSITLTDAATGGVWSSTSANATISSTGVVTGVTPGTAKISYTVTNACGTAAATKIITVNPLPNAGIISGPTVVCEVANISLTSTVTGGTWSTTGSNASVSSVGVVSGITAGTAIISYSVTNSCGTAVATYTVTVNPLPHITAMSGPDMVCVTTTVAFTASPAGGVWSSVNANATISSSGIVTGVNVGLGIIKYTVTNSCGSVDIFQEITVNPQPDAGLLSGPSNVCQGSNAILTASVPGGVWSSTPNVSVSSSGLVTGLTAGTATVSYSVTNICGTAVATKIVTVNPLPGPITGSNNVCQGLTTTLGNSAPGGTWISSNTVVAPIGLSSGIVTGATPGTSIIIYTLPTGCQVISSFTVNPQPDAGTITGPSAVCATVSITLTDAAPGGVWTTSNTNAIAMAGGIIIGAASGTSTVSYSVTNMCGTAVATKVITIDPAPDAGNIAGPATLCAGSTITLTDPEPGGSWISGSTHATISPAGLVTGISAGTAAISYSVTNSCGTDYAIRTITVNPLPVAGLITGPSAFCLGSSAHLTETVAGGSWTSSSGTANVTTGGDVTGTAGGSATISYSVTNMCGTAVATHPVTVDTFPVAGFIAGPSQVCLFATASLSDASPGGVWSSSPGATVSPTGIVTGTVVGTATITYTVSNTCGVATATKEITVNPLPDPGSIAGPSSLCQGTTITLTDAMPGGTWASTDSAATISSGGVVTGVSGGTATISYTVTGVFCPAAALKIITVNPLPDAGVINGLPGVCVSSTLVLTDAAPGGIWSSADPDVIVSTTGGVYGLTAGTAIISYTVTNLCGTDIATRIVTINPLPAPGLISGPSVICEDSALLITATIPGGTWSSSHATVATISPTGLVIGTGGGTTTISYTVASAFCTNTTTKIVTVNPLPNAGMLSIPAPVCLGTPISITTSVPGGIWTGDPAVIVSPAGVVTGISAGSYYVSYSVSNSCGTATALQIATFYPLPDPGTINGPAFICLGASAAYSETALIGTWSITGAATISATGVVTGTAPGTATITYIATNGVCTSMTSRVISINPVPGPGPVNGPSGACQGSNFTLTNVVPGGVWSSTGSAVTVSPTGVVTGIAAGTATITYTITNSCGTAYATKPVTIYAIPNAGSISGTATICVGASATLASSASGGVWSIGNPSIASISSDGSVTGITAGTAMVTYTVSVGPGCTSYVTQPVTVSPVPDAGLLAAPSGFCKGVAFTITPTVPGGVWSSSNSAIVSLTGEGSALAAGAGTATITYTVSNGGCSNQATLAVTILDGPAFALGSNITGLTCFDTHDGSIATSITGQTDPVEYLWSNGNNTASISSLAAGTYTVQVTETSTKCARSDVFTVGGPDSLAISSIVKGDQCRTHVGMISVSVSGGVSPYAYQWSNNATSSEITGLSSGTYTLTITDINTCKRDVELIVAEDSCLDIVVHDALTPNGDGVNDKWIIEGLDKYPNNMLQVFDKWGDLIFEVRNYDNNWVGRGRDGTVVPDGTYFYLLKVYADNLPGGQKVVTGSILIKR